MKKPQCPMDLFKRRREQLIDRLQDNEIIILASQPIYYRQNEIAFPYRQDSFFYYLTGFEEPESCLVLRKKSPSSFLFVQENNKEKELWEGSCFGPKRAQETFLMDECISIEKFQKTISSLIRDISYIYQIRAVNKDFNQRLDQILSEEKTKYSKNHKSYRFLDTRDYISQMRMIKDDYEIEQIKKACEISAQAHAYVMKACRPGLNERQLYGTFIQSIMNQNAERESYPGIFASGTNSLVLHYTDNNQDCKDGDLMLVDAGAEWEYYASDITRTFPVNGRFSPAQKIIYNHVLKIQKSIIEMVRPGTTLRRLQNHTLEMMFDCLKKENLVLSENKKDIKIFYPHNFGHLLGLDVHDVKYLKKDEKTLTLEPGMVLTVEPGIYIPTNLPEIPKKFQGIGIRIEDDVLVTKNGCQVLSQSLPKEADEIEKLMTQSKK